MQTAVSIFFVVTILNFFWFVVLAVDLHFLKKREREEFLQTRKIELESMSHKHEIKALNMRMDSLNRELGQLDYLLKEKDKEKK